MSLYGYTKPNHIKLNNLSCTQKAIIGGNLDFSFTFTLDGQAQAIGLCLIEFALYFIKANKKQHRKIFKISD